MPEQDSCTGEMQHADEVVDVTLPAGDQPPEVVQPSEKALDLPAAPVRKTHSTPFSTARGAVHGRPRPSGRRRGRKIGSRTAPCVSVRSMPRVRLAGANRNTWSRVYEMTS
jgi:hypothetical protein